MPDFLGPPAPLAGTIAPRPLAAPSPPKAGAMPMNWRGSKIHLAGTFAITANWQGAKTPLAGAMPKSWNGAALVSSPRLVRASNARRVSGLIHPRQFVGTRPEVGLAIPRAHGVGPFSPLWYSPLLWLDERGILNNGVGAGISDPVSLWGDQSGNGNHVAQTDASLRPQRAANGVQFDGGQLLVGNPDLANMETLFLVANRTGPGQPFGLINTNSAYHGWWSYADLVYSTFLNYEFNNAPLTGDARNFTPNTVNIFSLHSNHAPSGARQEWLLGHGAIGYAPLIGLVKEVIVFSRVLSAAERTRVNQYLAAKHSIAI